MGNYLVANRDVIGYFAFAWFGPWILCRNQCPTQYKQLFHRCFATSSNSYFYNQNTRKTLSWEFAV